MPQIGDGSTLMSMPSTIAPPPPPPPTGSSLPPLSLPGMTLGTGPTVNPQTAAKVRSGLNTALNYQFIKLYGHLTGKPNPTYDETMAALRQHIPGAQQLYSMGIPQDKLGAPGTAYRFAQDRAQDTVHAIIDAAISYPADPLTWESWALGPLGAGTKLGLQGLMKIPRFAAAWEKAAPLIEQGGKALMNSHAVAGVYDRLNWAGAVKREGKISVPLIRGGAGVASAEGSRMTQFFKERYQNIVEGVPIKTVDGRVRPGVKLSDDELKRVGQALNGEMSANEIAAMSAKEQTAYRQLRVLTNMDYAVRAHAYQTINIAKLSDPDVRQAVKDAFRTNTRPVIPQQNMVRMTPEEFAAQKPLRRPTYTGANKDAAMKMREQTMANMTPKEREMFGKALTGSQPHFNNLSPELQARVTQINKLRNTPDGWELLPPRQFKVENQAEINRMKQAREAYDTISQQMQKDLPRRLDYMPFKRKGFQVDEGHPGFVSNPTEYFDPHAMRRGGDEPLEVTSTAQVRQGFEAMASNVGHQRATAVLHDVLGEFLKDPNVQKAFTKVVPATGSFRTSGDWWRDALLGGIGYPRAGIVSMTPRHAFNVYDLAVNTVPLHQLPQFTARMSKLMAQLIVANPRKAMELTADGRKLFGTAGSRFAEHKAFFQKFPEEIPLPAWPFGKDKAIPIPFIGGKQTNIQLPKGIPLIGGRNVGLGAYTNFNNRVVWAADYAAKTIYAQMLENSKEVANEVAKRAASMDPARAKQLIAGGLARARMVDYENKTALQEFMRYLSPFGTFRGGIPGAVLGGVKRDVPRSAFLSRASGGTFYGDRPVTGQQGSPGPEYSAPTSDVGEAMTPWEGVSRQITNTLGVPQQAALGFLEDVLSQSGPAYKRLSMWENPRAFGQAWLPGPDKSGRYDIGWLATQALAGVPEAETLLERMGISRYQWRGWAHELLRQTTGWQWYEPPGSATGGLGQLAPLPVPH